MRWRFLRLLREALTFFAGERRAFSIVWFLYLRKFQSLEEHDGLTVGEVYAYVRQRRDDPVVRHYLSLEHPHLPVSLQQIIAVSLPQMGYVARGPKGGNASIGPSPATEETKKTKQGRMMWIIREATVWSAAASQPIWLLTIRAASLSRAGTRSGRARRLRRSDTGTRESSGRDCPVVDRRGLERRRARRERMVVVLCLVACSCQPDTRDEDRPRLCACSVAQHFRGESAHQRKAFGRGRYLSIFRTR